MADTLHGHMGNMHQAVFVQTDINECTEVNDVSDCTGELIAYMEVTDLKHITSQQCAFKLITVVSERLTDRIFNVLQCIAVDAEFLNLFFRELCIRCAKLGNAAYFHDFSGCFIALRMDRSFIQRFITVLDAQEACTLCKCLRTELLDFQQLIAVRESAVLIAVVDDLFGCSTVQTGNMCQQFLGSCIQVRTCTVDALHDCFIQAFIQCLFRQVMLVLTDTDGLRIDLDQFCQRVEQSSADGYGRTFLNSHIRELGSCGFLSRPYGSTCFGNDRIADIQCIVMDQFCNKLLALSGSSAVADRNDLHAVLFDQSQQFAVGTFDITVLAEREDLVYRQHLSCFIQYCKLAAVVETGVKAKNDSSLQRRLGQQLFKVQREHFDRAGVCTIGQIASDLIFHAGQQQSFAAIFDCILQFCFNDRFLTFLIDTDRFILEIFEIIAECNCYDLFLLSTVDRHYTMICDLRDLFRTVIIHFIDMLLVLGILLFLSNKNT